MTTLLERLVEELNRTIFFREFSYSKNTFCPKPGEIKEFADHVVWIDDLLIIYQLKERDGSESTTSDDERNWFERKVISKATKQVRDTLKFLKDYPRITIQNQRGHSFDLDAATVKNVLKIVLYNPTGLLPEDCRRTSHYLSKSAGFIHLLPWSDYREVCRTLLTPSEFAEYFEFRQKLIELMTPAQKFAGEQAALGHYLSGRPVFLASEQFIDYFLKLKQKRHEFDLGPLLYNLGEKIERSEGDLGCMGYYKILMEFAKLKRNELMQVKIRVDLCMESAKKGEFRPPTRLFSPSTGCGFLFFAADPARIRSRHIALKNFVYASMYEQKCRRHVGVSFSKDRDDWLIDWSLMDLEWVYDPEMERRLNECNPFTPLREEQMGRYEFD